jgi:hypothetical protein
MSDKTEHDRILGRIQSLAVMADPERGGTPGEVENAAKLMKQLMDRYNISLLDVMSAEEDDPNNFIEFISETLLGQTKPWHWGLARAIATITSTKYYAAWAWGKTMRDPSKEVKGRRMAFFGTKGGVQSAAWLYDTWVHTIDDMAKKATGEYCARVCEELGVTSAFKAGLRGEEHPNTWRSSWTTGVIAGINNVLWEQQKEQREADRAKEEAAKLAAVELQAGEAAPMTTTSALMVLSGKIDLAYKQFSREFKSVKTGARLGNYGAYAQGVKVGRGINLNAKRLKD